MPRCPTNLDNSRARAYCACSGWCFDVFSRHSYPFSSSLSLEDGSIFTDMLSKPAVKPKTTNLSTTLVISMKFHHSFFLHSVILARSLGHHTSHCSNLCQPGSVFHFPCSFAKVNPCLVFNTDFRPLILSTSSSLAFLSPE